MHLMVEVPQARLMVGRTIWRAGSVANYHLSATSSEVLKGKWLQKDKKDLARDLTSNTLVESRTATREATPFDRSRPIHPEVKLLQTKHYRTDVHDAVDKIPAHCPEHLMLMRMAIGIARNPTQESVDITNAIAGELCHHLLPLDDRTLRSIFTVGGNIHESRSKELIEEIGQWKDTLKSHTSLPPNKLLRVLETVVSPLSTIISTNGTNFCLIASALKKGQDIGHLEDFILSIEDAFTPFRIPYIKSPEGPFFHLNAQQYAYGEELTDEELVTLNHFLEICEDCDPNNLDTETLQSIAAKVPVLRQVKIKDPTARSNILHVGLNVPHYFDVSGTTGSVMQVVMGILKLGNKQSLIASPDEFRRYGMTFAGCNFTKQGYHNFYEILPALEWGAENVFNVRGHYNLAPADLVDATGRLLKDCVDPNSSIAPTICQAADVVTEHNLLHYDLYKRELELELETKAHHIQELDPDDDTDDEETDSKFIP